MSGVDDGSRVSSLLASAGTHKPSLSVLIRNADLPAASDRARNGRGEEEDDEDGDEGALALAGDGPLSHEQFAGEEWDVNEFLLSKRHVALDDLKRELRAYLAQLKASLVGVINDEYETFISLSLGLKQANVAHSLGAIKRPVLGLRQQVAKVKEELERKRDEIDALLDQKSDVRSETAELKRLLDVDELAAKVEDWLGVSSSAPPPPPPETTARDDEEESTGAKKLERVANEYKQLVYLFSKAMRCPFLDSIEPRIAKLGDVLVSRLQSAFETALRAEARADEILLLLRTFATLEAHEAAEATLKSALVSPFVVRTITADCLSRAAPPATTSPGTIQLSEGVRDQPPRGSVAAALSSVYNDLVAFLTKRIAPLLELAQKAQPTPPEAATTTTLTNRFEIIARVVFPEIAARLTSEVGTTIFSAGRPAVFYENYTLTRQLVDRIERMSVDRASLERFRSTDAYATFMRRFQLPVYFQLRFKEIVTSVERAFADPSGGGGATTASEHSFLLPETEAIWRAVETCWRDGVYIDELAARFWRLTLQLLVRYRTWAHKAAPRSTITSSSSSSNLASLAAAGGGAVDSSSSQTSSRNNARLAPASASSSNGASRPGTPQMMNEEQTDDQTLRQCSVLTSDIVTLRANVLRLWDDRIQRSVSLSSSSGPISAADGDGEDGVVDPHQVLVASLDALSSVLPSLADQIVSVLVKRATKPLKSAGTVASQVRASSQQQQQQQSAVVEVSYFVPAILKDVKAYESGVGRFVDGATRAEWKARILEDVLIRYAAILQSQKKAQDSLSWLKRGRQGLSFFSRSSTPATPTGSAGGGGEGDQQQDEDRFAAQMEADVNALAQDAKSIGVDVDRLEGWRTLRSAISTGASSSSSDQHQQPKKLS